MDYKDQIKHPKWQKKRLEILERDNYTCQKCDNKESTLHVHHVWYNNKLKYWEYPDRCYITFCENCHGEIHNKLDTKINNILDEPVIDEIIGLDNLDREFFEYIIYELIKFNKDNKKFIVNFSSAINSSDFINFINFYSKILNDVENTNILVHTLNKKIRK